MATLFFPNGGEVIFLTDALANDSTWNMHLYQNDYTPTDSDTVSDYTECDFNGYSSMALTKDGSVYTDANGKAHQDYAVNEFSASGGNSNDVYGYYLTDSGGNLIAALRFDSAPITVGDGGTSQLNVEAFITALNEV